MAMNVSIMKSECRQVKEYRHNNIIISWHVDVFYSLLSGVSVIMMQNFRFMGKFTLTESHQKEIFSANKKANGEAKNYMP